MDQAKVYVVYRIIHSSLGSKERISAIFLSRKEAEYYSYKLQKGDDELAGIKHNDFESYYTRHEIVETPLSKEIFDEKLYKKFTEQKKKELQNKIESERSCSELNLKKIAEFEEQLKNL